MRLVRQGPKGAIFAELQAINPDGRVSLELNATREDLQIKQINLVEGQYLRLWDYSGDVIFEVDSIVHLDQEWGWEAEVDPVVMAEYQARLLSGDGSE